jgi:hypothetical protein
MHEVSSCFSKTAFVITVVYVLKVHERKMRNISHEMKSCMRSKNKLGFARKNIASPVSRSPFYSLRKRKKSANSIELLITRQLLPIFSFRFPLSIFFAFFCLHFRFHWTRFFLGQFPVLIEFLFLNVFYFFRRDFYFECCFFISDRRFKTFWQHFIKIGLIFLFLE